MKITMQLGLLFAFTFFLGSSPISNTQIIQPADFGTISRPDTNGAFFFSADRNESNDDKYLVGPYVKPSPIGANAVIHTNTGSRLSQVMTNGDVDASLNETGVLREAIGKEQRNTTFHLFGHGRSGELFLEGKWLGSEEIKKFFTWRSAAQITGLNIYGRNFAKGKKGLEAVAYLEKELGIPVSAPNNITGVGGDWKSDSKRIGGFIEIFAS